MSNRKKGSWGHQDIGYPPKNRTKKTWEKYDNDEVSGGCMLALIVFASSFVSSFNMYA